MHQTTVVPPVIPLRTSQASIGKPQKQLLSLTSAPAKTTAFDTLPTVESTSLATALTTETRTTEIQTAETQTAEIQIDSAASTHTTDKPSEESTTVESIQAVASAQDSKHVCWIGEKRSPLQADHQVELLHLQAEADALLIKLQSAESRKMTEVARR
ncbi:MAG: hypothetical protein AAFY72_10790 [Cyanobacteria bacterium J06649_4]